MRGNDWLEEIRWLEDMDGTTKRHTLASRPLSGKSVSILGGGPGLTAGIAAYLMQYPVICVNNSFMLMDRKTLVVALDRRWWEWHGQSIRGRGDVAVTSLRPSQANPSMFGGYAMRKERNAVYDPSPAVLCGQNSGHAAIHLAMHLGASRIYLAGFDMGFPNGKTHWHGGHAVPPSETNYTSRFRPALEQLARLAEDQASVRIQAVTPTAASIRTLPLERALNRLAEDHGYRVDHPPASTALPG